ncbi:MAG: hypothetical protein GY940_34775, partial [bacterium]|nr:hypothetical protein [bacterium]
MNIEDHIKESHERLSKNSTRFLEYVQRKPGSLLASSYPLLDINDPLVTLQPWPTFINKQTKKQMDEAGLGVLNLMKSLPRRIFSNDYEKISRYYGVSNDLVNYFMRGVTDKHLENLMARGDFVFTGSGLKCIEYNVNTNLGGLVLSYWESLSMSTPVIREFMTQHNVELFNKNPYHYLFEHLVSQAREFYPGTDEINIAFVIPAFSDDSIKQSQERYFNGVYREVMGSTFNRLPGEVFIDKFSQLSVKGDDVLCNNKKVHFLVEWSEGFIPKEILKVFEDGKLLVCNGAIAWLLSTKLNLALLSEMEDSELFSAAEREIIKKHIPWTRKIIPGETTYEGQTVQLKEFMLSNREKLVLKPILGSAGKDIYIGHYTSPAEWKQMVETAMTWNDWQDVRFGDYPAEMQWYQIAKKAFEVKNWLVQEYIEPPTYLYQLGENGCAEHHAV